MRIVRLAEPSPSETIEFEPFRFNSVAIEYLAVPSGSTERPFFEVLSARTSHRSFRPLSRAHLAELLWHTARIRSCKQLSHGHEWMQKTVPSAGGRHPIHLLILEREDVHVSAKLYDASAHCLHTVGLLRHEALEEFHSSMSRVAAEDGGTLIWLVVEYPRTMSRYTHGESLVWRDAGAMVATMSLVAEAIECRSCIVGAVGDDFVLNVFQSQSLGGAGGIFVGE